MDELRTSDAVIDALGGTAKVSRLTGRKMSSVSNWRERGAFPSETFLILNDGLKGIGKRAPASLWGMMAVPSSSAVEAAA